MTLPQQARIFKSMKQKPKTTQVSPSELLNVQEAATYIRLAPRTLYNYASVGLLRSYKIGFKLAFRREDLDGLIVVRPTRRSQIPA